MTETRWKMCKSCGWRWFFSTLNDKLCPHCQHLHDEVPEAPEDGMNDDLH